MKRTRKIVGIVMSFVLLTSVYGNVSGAIGESQKQRINEIESENNALESKRSEAQSKLNSIDSQISELSNTLIATNEKLKDTNSAIKKNKKQLAAAQEDEKSQYADMKLRIQYMYENGDTQIIDLLFNSDSVTDFLAKAEYITELTEYDRQMLNKLVKTRKKIASTKKKLETEKKELETLQAKQEGSISELNSLSAQKQNEIDSYDGTIAMNRANEAELQKEVESLMQAEKERQEAARLEESRKRAEAEKNKTTVAATQRATERATEAVTTPPETTASPKPANTGGFTWPLPGHYNISSDYGDTSGRSSGHSGIDITAPIGTAIVAAASGTVSWAYSSASAGMYVGINHGGGVVSEYMHMSSFTVSAGQSVSAGQVIGYVGMTGYTTGPHLHFGIQFNGVRVNPHNYVG